ncbi:MAG TPA: TetR family transcriptional regulator [Actinomycetota bacterium]|nr:TetR family transcriptional regulator [Actinomycetota bacterium]
MIEAVAEQTTKDRIVEACLETLKEEGFAGTSARAIARRGGFNQALIFYHFGTLNDLLLAALDRTSERRLSAYRAALAAAESVEEKVASATRLYRDDLASGHVTVVSEMIAGSLSRPDLGPEVVARMDPWIDFVEESVREPLDRAGLSSVLPPRTAAFMVVSLTLGVNLLWHLERDQTKAEALFEAAGRIARMLAPAFGGSDG